MAVVWSSAYNTGSNGIRVGIDLDYSLDGAVATIVHELWVWTRRASFGSSASYRRGGTAGSGSGSFSYSHPVNDRDWSTSNQTRIGRWTTTRTLQYGSEQTITASGGVSGLSGNMPSGWIDHSVSRDLPARQEGRPDAPSGVQVTRVDPNDDSRHLVNWTRNNPNDPTKPYHTVRLERWDNVSGQYLRIGDIGNVPQYLNQNTVSNRRYRYRVRAVNDAGMSDWAYSEFFYTTPAPPRDVSAVRTGSGIRVSWSRYAFDAAQYEVQDAPAGSWGPTYDAGVHAWQWTHADPDLAVTHRYRVRTHIDGLVSAWSSPSGTLQLSAPPSAPTNLGPSSPWDATEDRRLTWRHVPVDGSEQQAFEVSHRRYSPGDPQPWTWTGRIASSEEGWTLPADTYSNGDIVEWQVATWGVHPERGPRSASNLQSPTARPTVAINSPAEGEVITTSTVVVSWGYFQEDDSPQVAWVATLRDHNGNILERHEGTGETETEFQVDTDRTYRVVVDAQSADGLWWRGGDDPTEFSVEFLAPAAPSIDRVTWDVGTGATIVELSQPVWDETHAEPSHHRLWRAINDGAWLLIADDVPLGSTVTDPIPAIGDGHVNYYKATTVSVLPSTADSEVQTLAVPSTGKGGTRGWVYFNSGPGMSTVCRVVANATRDDEEGTEAELDYDSGRTSPTIQGGTAHSLTWRVAARIAPDYDGASTREELVAMQRPNEPVMFRDPLGARWVGYMGKISSNWRNIVGEVSFPMQQVDFVEGLAERERDGVPQP